MTSRSSDTAVKKSACGILQECNFNLRTPMNSLIGYAEHLSGGFILPGSEAWNECAKMIEQAATGCREALDRMSDDVAILESDNSDRPLTDAPFDPVSRRTVLRRIADHLKARDLVVATFDVRDCDHYMAADDLDERERVVERLIGLLDRKLPEADIMRLGNTDFVILVESRNSLASMRKIVMALEVVRPLGAFCVGLTAARAGEKSASALLHEAHMALRAAENDLGSQSKKLVARAYTGAVAATASRHIRLRKELEHSIDLGQMHLMYQPQIDLATGRTAGCEALLRWTHPLLGMVSPAHFVPIAEAVGLINPIGDWVIDEAVKTARSWRQAGHDGLSVSVNISPVQLTDTHLADRILAAVHREQLPPSALRVEVTESTLISSVKNASTTLETLYRAGIATSIDDFGTGHSSLYRLKQLPVRYVKIDRSFVRDICTSSKDRAIVGATIDMAHNLGMSVIGEGTETEDQVQTLKDMHCDQVQGFHFSRPLPAEDFSQYIARAA